VPKVIDFGVAKATEQKLTERTLFTQYGTMVGTFEYMSPEQAEMSALGVDTRSDIYSLGVLLYELLTGSTPLTHKRMKEAAYAEILRMIKEEEPPRPSTRLSDSGEALVSISANRHTEPAKLTKLVRGELDWIVMKTLEKDRSRRYETANGFAADIQRYLAGEAVTAVPPSVGYRFRKFARRNRGPVLAAALVLLALLVGIVGTTVGMIRATRAEAEAVNEAVQKDGALKDKEVALSAAQQSERDAKDQLFLALLNEARAVRFSRQMGQRLDSLAAVEKASRIRFDERLRDEAIAAMALPDVRRGPSLHAYPAGTTSYNIDGRYQTYARIDDQGITSIRSLPDNEEIRCIKTEMKPGTTGAVRLSPDGRFLAVFGEDHAVQLWRVADGKPLLGEALRPCRRNLEFSPDSRQLAVVNDDSVVCIDLASGRETSRWRLPAVANRLAFDPDSSRLAVGYADNKVASIYDTAQGGHVADLPVGCMTWQVVAWHPDGTRLAVAGSDPRIQIWDVAKQRRLATLEGHVELVSVLSFHPDGSLLASTSHEGVVRLWDPATGRQLMQLPLNGDPRFSSSGQYLGHIWQGGDRLQLLEVTASPEYRTIVSSLGAGEGAYHEGDISPDGRLLALGMGSGGDRLWELSSGRELAVLPSQSNCVLFQPDGREILACGWTGLQRWPIQERKDASELRLGPPRKIALPFAPHRAARSPDGRTLAIVSETSGAGLRLDLASESVQGQQFEHPRAAFVTLSQNGRWVASSGWHSDRVRLWNAQTGKMVHEWVLGSITTVDFTPDSRALITCRGDGFTFWDVDTLRQVRRLDREVPHYPGFIAFSRDGKLMALEMEPAVIHLKEVATGRTVARLEDPHGDRAGWMGFTPDGTQLVVAAGYARAIHVWDLRVIRGRLKGMGLDWDWPEFRPADPRAKAAEIRKVDVLPGQDP
jgi:WD40 repeat protein